MAARYGSSSRMTGPRPCEYHGNGRGSGLVLLGDLDRGLPIASRHDRALGDAPTGGPTGASGRGRVFNPHDRALGDAPTSASSRGRAFANMAAASATPRETRFSLGGSSEPRPCRTGHGRDRVTSRISLGGYRVPRPCRLRAWPRFWTHVSRVRESAAMSSFHGHGRGDRSTLTGESTPSRRLGTAAMSIHGHGRGDRVTCTSSLRLPGGNREAAASPFHARRGSWGHPQR